MEVQNHGRVEVEVSPENCLGCLRCQLACSDRYSGRFNPSAARLKIIERLFGEGFLIEYMDECVHCGLCARSCGFGALKIRG